MANYSDLRARTMGAAQEEEAVTVNTRALIDKVLARYSSENTTLRELLQNAADANATSIEVRFETVQDTSGIVEYGENAKLLQLAKSKVQRVLVKNNGQAFREEDWQRLKRIAEGNPDETKIGAFGVGFYSVFADCEEPFVSSGDQAMAFYWKGNSLFTRRAKMDTHDPYTTFLLDYREPTELPDLRRLCKFFTTSLTFVKLNSIALYVDDTCLLQLNKKSSPPMPLDIPRTITPVTTEKVMTIVGVEESRVQLDAKYMNITHYQPPAKSTAGLVQSFFLRVAAPQVTTKSNINVSNVHEYTEATIFLRIATAKVKTKVAQKFAQELERATKKPPPSLTSLAILTMSRNEILASQHESEIFENVIPSKTGKVFIGFPTHQTTSIQAHISAQSVIPTVERENIDLNARIIKTWNIEMLRVAGILARIIYIDEMGALRKRADGLKPKDLEGLYEDASHVMNQFTNTLSTPSSQVGEYVAQGFWECNKQRSIELLSTRGVLPSTDVRLSSDVKFLDGLPIFPPELVSAAPTFVEQLTRAAYITELTVTDIQDGLAKKPLDVAQGTMFLEWIITRMKRDEIDGYAMDNLLASTIILITAAADGSAVQNSAPIPLGGVRFFVNASKLTSDLPLPPDCVPFVLTKSIKPNDLCILGWDELGIDHWVEYVTTNSKLLPVELNIEKSAQFAQQLLAIVSKAWDQLPLPQKDGIVNLLKPRTCIPTKQGMRTPGESYFPTVKLFADLPTVYGLHNIKDKTLVALGVRKTVDLKIVFERLMDESNAGGTTKWSHVDLIRYLTSVRNDIPAEDVRRLQNTAICKCEGGDKTLFKVSELYEPTEELRKLKFPLLQWPGEWRAISSEAVFLFKLGLLRYPNEVQLLRKAAQRDDDILRENALRYYISNFNVHNYQPHLVFGFAQPFLPLARGSSEKGRLSTPQNCYSNPSSAILGFDVLREDLQGHGPKFGVRMDPSIQDCVDRLIAKPPAGPREAVELFTYFGKRSTDLPAHLAQRVGNSKIVPVRRGKEVKHIQPIDCYIGSADNTYGEIFDFVDFGSVASAFLMRCGSKPEPTVSEIAYQVAREPAKLYGIFQSEEKYLRTLKHIAEHWSMLKKDKHLVKELRTSPCLGAHVDIPIKRAANRTSDKPLGPEDEDVETIKQFELARVDQIVLIGYDYANYMIFRGEVTTAPQDDDLELFYASLGCVQLSSKVTDQAFITPMPGPPDASGAVELRQLVLERTRLFLHQQEKHSIKAEARSLESNLDVRFVKSIRLKKTLQLDGKQPSHEQQRTATVQTQGNKRILFVTRKYQTYDIATQMIYLVLHKAQLHAIFLLDSFLSTDLYTLKARGFNVDRILRAKQAEARLMEQTRLKQVEEQQKMLEAEERAFQEKQRQVEAERARQKAMVDKASLSMPGGFQETPEKAKNAEMQPQDSGFFGKGFTRFSKLLGGHERKNSHGQGAEPPLPPDPAPQSQAGPIKPSPESGRPPPSTVTEPHRLRTNLLRAIQAGRSHSSSSLFSAPETFEVKEEKHFCDPHPGQDLSFAAATPLKFYFSNSLPAADRETWMRQNVGALHGFTGLLGELAEVYALDPNALHIYYDEQGETIAFNRAGSVFCNIRFFLQLGQWDKERYTGAAMSYWFVILAHELAHNLRSDHGSEHSFYAESFVQEYFDKAMVKVAAAEHATLPAPQPARQSKQPQSLLDMP